MVFTGKDTIFSSQREKNKGEIQKREVKVICRVSQEKNHLPTEAEKKNYKPTDSKKDTTYIDWERKINVILFFSHFSAPMASSKLLTLDNKNKKDFILYCARLIVTLH